MAQPLLDCKMLARLYMVLAKLDKVLSSANLGTDILHRKKKILNQIGPIIKPCDTPNFIV